MNLVVLDTVLHQAFPKPFSHESNRAPIFIFCHDEMCNSSERLWDIVLNPSQSDRNRCVAFPDFSHTSNNCCTKMGGLSCSPIIFTMSPSKSDFIALGSVQSAFYVFGRQCFSKKRRRERGPYGPGLSRVPGAQTLKRKRTMSPSCMT